MRFDPVNFPIHIRGRDVNEARHYETETKALTPKAEARRLWIT